MVKKRTKVIIAGAAGRDYHIFLTYFKDNPQYGDPIAKKLIPKVLINKHVIKNLYRVELSNY